MVRFLPVAIARERSLDHSNRALHRTLLGILRAPSGGVASPASIQTHAHRRCLFRGGVCHDSERADAARSLK